MRIKDKQEEATMIITITAVARNWNNVNEEEIVEKEFQVEVRENNKLYNPELVEWVASMNTNLFTVLYDGKKFTYSL